MHEKYIPLAGGAVLRELLPALLEPRGCTEVGVRLVEDQVWVQWRDGLRASQVRELLDEHPCTVSRDGVRWRVPEIRCAREVSLQGAVAAVLGGADAEAVLLSVRGSRGALEHNTHTHWREAHHVLEVALGCLDLGAGAGAALDVAFEQRLWRERAPMHNHHRRVRSWLATEGVALAACALTA